MKAELHLRVDANLKGEGMLGKLQVVLGGWSSGYIHSLNPLSFNPHFVTAYCVSDTI